MPSLIADDGYVFGARSKDGKGAGFIEASLM